MEDRIRVWAVVLLLVGAAAACSSAEDGEIVESEPQSDASTLTQQLKSAAGGTSGSAKSGPRGTGGVSPCVTACTAPLSQSGRCCFCSGYAGFFAPISSQQAFCFPSGN
jgi:hypothetical protein